MEGARIYERAALLVLVSVISGLAQQAKAITLNFSNLDNTEINFSSGAFSFTSDVNGDQFHITTVSGGVGDSVGLKGFLLPAGPFSIGAISIAGPIQSALVSGTATLDITDASSENLLGSIQWLNVTTIDTAGVLNLMGMINLTGITYSGSNSDLATLAAAGAASDVVTFQFDPAMSLTQLAASSGESTSYSGTITTVPEPMSISLVGLASLLAFRRPARAGGV